MADVITNNDDKERQFEKLVAEMVFTWPWYYPNHLEEIRHHPLLQRLADWAKTVLGKTLDDIASGQLVNEWESPY